MGKDGFGNNGGFCSYFGIVNVGYVGDGCFGFDVGVFGFNKGFDFGVMVEYGIRMDVGEWVNLYFFIDDCEGDFGMGDGGFFMNFGVGDSNVWVNCGFSFNGGSFVEEYFGI